MGGRQWPPDRTLYDTGIGIGICIDIGIGIGIGIGIPIIDIEIYFANNNSETYTVSFVHACYDHICCTVYCALCIVV